MRELMALRAEEHAEYWSEKFGTTPQGAAHVARTAGTMAERWRSDERLYVGAWELPTWARGSIRPSLNVWVNGDGSLDLPPAGGALADVVVLASRRPPAD